MVTLERTIVETTKMRLSQGPMSGKTRLVDWGCLKGERLLQYPGFSSDKTFFELFVLLASCVDVM